MIISNSNKSRKGNFEGRGKKLENNKIMTGSQAISDNKTIDIKEKNSKRVESFCYFFMYFLVNKV